MSRWFVARVLVLAVVVVVSSMTGSAVAQEDPRGVYVSGGLLVLHVNGQSGDTTDAVGQVGGSGLRWQAAFEPPPL